jgi:hypothetical protein
MFKLRQSLADHGAGNVVHSAQFAISRKAGSGFESLPFDFGDYHLLELVI